MARAGTVAAALDELRQAALGYPGAHEDHPWDHWVAKVNGKIFVFLDELEGKLRITAKLPRSGVMALSLPGTEPTGYGMGKHGWVSGMFPPRELPVPLLREWIEESYRAVAPKKLLKQLDAGSPSAAGAPAKAAPARKRRRAASGRRPPAR